MDYIELTLDAADAEQAKILTAELADFPFESFEQEGARLKAYIPQERLADCKGEVDALLARYGVGRATFLSIEPQNWNALWESNFTPVEVDGRLTIRAPFHAPAATEAEVGIIWYDLKYLLNETPDTPKPVVHVPIQYRQYPFSQVEEEYRNLFDQLSAKICK